MNKQVSLQEILNGKSMRELIGLCRHYRIKGYSGKTKLALVAHILEHRKRIVDAALKGMKAGEADRQPSHEAMQAAVQASFWDKYHNHIYGIATIIGLIVAMIPVMNGAFKRISSPTMGSSENFQFDRTADGFHTLILPFARLKPCTDGDNNIEETVKHRLVQKGETGNLPLQVWSYSTVESPATFEQARKLGEQAEADMVIWGHLYDYCEKITVCFRYLLVKKIAGDFSKFKQEKTQTLILPDIMEGKMQDDMDFIIHWALGYQAFERKDYSRALMFLEPIREQGSTFVAQYMGVSFENMGDLKNAIDQFDKLIELDPRNAGHFLKRGKAQLKQALLESLEWKKIELLNKARADFKRAILLDPNSPAPRSLLGSLKEETSIQKDWEKVAQREGYDVYLKDLFAPKKFAVHDLVLDSANER